MRMTISLELVCAAMMSGQHQFRMPACRMAFGMGHDSGGNKDVEPPGFSEAITEIDVLHVHEVSRVEPGDGVEGITSDQQARPGKPTDGALGDGLVLLTVTGSPRVLRPHGAEQCVPDARGDVGHRSCRRIDAAVRFEDLRPQCTGPWPPICRSDQFVE